MGNAYIFYTTYFYYDKTHINNQPIGINFFVYEIVVRFGNVYIFFIREYILNYQEFLNKITFRFIQPETNIPLKIARFINTISQIGFPLERWIVKLPEKDKYFKKGLKPICRMPKMSSFTMGVIINQAVTKMPKDEIYVNVGVWHGFTLLAGMFNNDNKQCIGIDNWSHKSKRNRRAVKQFPLRFSKQKSENHIFHQMDYQKYFAEIHAGTIGCYLYDGVHHYENQLEALQLAEPYFSNDCIVIVDDTNKDEPRSATLDFIEKSKNQYSILFDRQTACNAHPTLWDGIMVFQKINN